MKKSNAGLLKLAILAIAFVTQANTIASILLGDIAQSFPEVGMTGIQMIMTLGMIGAFPVTLSVGFLTSKIRKKPMILLGMVMIAAGGVLPILIRSSLPILYASALIVGAGQGFLLPLVSTLVIESFQGEEQHKMLGLNTSVMNVGNVTLLLLAGVLAKTGWVNVYFLYLFTVPVFFIVSVFLPKGELPEAPKSDSKGEQLKVKVPGLVYVSCLINFLFYIGYVTFPISISLYLSETGLGDAAVTSLVMTLNTGFGIVAGLVFAKIIKQAKLYIFAIAGVFATIGFGLIYFAQNMTMVYLASAFLGMCFGISNAGGGYVMSRITTPEQLAPSFSVSMTFITAGVIASPIVVNMLTRIWTSGNANPKDAFLTALFIIITMTVVHFIWAGYLTKKAYPEMVPGKMPQ